MIYLDNAATTRPKPPGVAEAVTAAMNEYGNSGRGTHPEALEAARKARDLAPDNPRIQKNLQLIEGKLAPA